jgi:hypothetical protein
MDEERLKQEAERVRVHGVVADDQLQSHSGLSWEL